MILGYGGGEYCLLWPMDGPGVDEEPYREVTLKGIMAMFADVHGRPYDGCGEWARRHGVPAPLGSPKAAGRQLWDARDPLQMAALRLVGAAVAAAVLVEGHYPLKYTATRQAVAYTPRAGEAWGWWIETPHGVLMPCVQPVSEAHAAWGHDLTLVADALQHGQLLGAPDVFGDLQS